MSITKKSCCGTREAAPQQQNDVKEFVKKRYADRVKAPGMTSCCGTASGSCDSAVALSAGYTEEQLAGVPAHAAEHSFGCGNPVALAGIRPGQTVLDIGSGAGIDVLLAARKAGPEGHVIGLDMTIEMIEAATKNAVEAGLSNVEFRLGDAEDMPVESGTVDWIISNCVINLAPDKAKVFAEAYRVLRPGGRILVSDLVTHGLPETARKSLEAWAFCVGGALEEEDYLAAIRGAGFKSIPDELARLAPSLAGKVSSIKIGAVKF
ncbi:MAG: arsenite methyltransferase [Candidatus Hydrogenedentes bacterium]|nr:arsenite methyltransferase [Candidatus Hydrogenedentota bacterium]